MKLVTKTIPPGYKIIRRDRTSRGGGVTIVAKSSVQVISLIESKDTEILCVKLNIYAHVFVLCAVYRPPDSAPDYLLKISDHISQLNKSKLLMVGGFNLPGIDWDRIKSGAGSVRDANVLFDLMLVHNLVQLVREPTRHATGIDSLFDLAFLDRSFSSYHVSVEPGLSDHDIVAVYFSLNVKHTPDTRAPVIVKDFARADDISVMKYLAFVNFAQVTSLSFVPSLKPCAYSA